MDSWFARCEFARRRCGALAAAAVVLAVVPAAADNRVGGWSSLAAWPLIPIHAVLLGDGRVMTYGTNGAGKPTGNFIYDVWEPRLGLVGTAHTTLPNATGTDLFCSAQLVLPGSGDVFLAGGAVWTGQHVRMVGNSDSALFDPTHGTLARGGGMNRARFYATATTLPDGRTYIQGGRGQGGRGGGGEDHPELRDTAGAFRLLPGVATGSLHWWYPRNWVAPDGRIFGYADLAMYYVDPDANGGAGALAPAGSMPADGPRGVSSSEVMYAPGKILRVGGGALELRAAENGRDGAVVIDINGPAPLVTRAAALPARLHWHTATVIADGRVVVTGGSLKSNQLVGVSDRALIWNPGTGQWTEGARGSGRARLYHSTALLLPDGSVLVGGGGAPGPQKNTDAEVYHPPYLYMASGGFATRPRITSAPDRLTVGQDFSLAVDRAGDIRRVTLVKTGSVTHSFNMEQRFMELPFTASGGTLLVSAPVSLNRAPPGNYLLFVLDALGVPSLGRVVAVADTGSPAPSVDGLQYVASYGDLIRAFGADTAAGEWHYQQVGNAEGRSPDAFDEIQYLANYADLRAMFGADLEAATRHYIAHGYYEGRTDKAP